MSISPAVARFLVRHARSETESVADDVEYAHRLTLEERTEQLAAACRLAVELVDASPNPERARQWQESPHPTYRAIIKRLRDKALADGWSFKTSSPSSDTEGVGSAQDKQPGEDDERIVAWDTVVRDHIL